MSSSAVRAQTLQNAKVPVIRLLPLRVHVSNSDISLQEGTCSWETFADFPGDDFWSCFRNRGSTADTRAHTSVHGFWKNTFFYVKMDLRSRGRQSSLRLLVLVRLRCTSMWIFREMTSGPVFAFSLLLGSTAVTVHASTPPLRMRSCWVSGSRVLGVRLHAVKSTNIWIHGFGSRAVQVLSAGLRHQGPPFKLCSSGSARKSTHAHCCAEMDKFKRTTRTLS